MHNAMKHIISMGLFFGFLLLALGSLGNQTPEQKAQAECEDKVTAFVTSQWLVETLLKAPSTAKFPYITDSEVTVRYVGNCTHEVNAYVDSQNSFGAMIRTRYYVKLQYMKSTNKWKPIKVKIK